MKYSSRIRLYLIIIAILPPIVIMFVIYFSGIKEAERTARIEADIGLKKYQDFEKHLYNRLENELVRLSTTNEFGFSENRNIERNLSSVRLGLTSSYLDFIEIIDSSKKVYSSKNRPALIGTKLTNLQPINLDNTKLFTRQIEFNRQGGHPSLGLIYPLTKNRYMYAGEFIDVSMISIIEKLMNAKLKIIEENNNFYRQMEFLKLYELDKSYISILQGSENDNLYLIAKFDYKQNDTIIDSLLITVTVVSFFSIMLAIAIGIFVTERNKREMENLIQATERIAEGDFTTPIMALEEGQYSQLADSFTDMMIRLKKLQNKLSTTEKIAAWQTIGRKIAHELKNPLTPILISIDDLKSAYSENLPNFDKTFKETSDTIKKEVERMNELINEFVSFAKMKTADPQPTKVKLLIDEIRSIYKNKIESNQLIINNKHHELILPLDLSLMKQVLINLIKNGFESVENSCVMVNTILEKDQFIITVEDNGPGFTEEKLKNSFEPFVTTKPEGSGLGLVISHRIVNDHNGIMELHNKEDGGGIVKITLPI